MKKLKNKIKNKTKTPSEKEKIKKKKEKPVITSKMTFSEIFEKCPDAIGVLFESGLHCVGCGMAQSETLEQGCQAHGMNKKQIDFLIKKMNDGVLLKKEPTMVEKRNGK